MTSPNIEILAHEESPLGALCLRRRRLLSEPDTVVTEITLNHEFLMSSHHTASERALATEALDLHHGTELQVLVGGLGLGYTACEVLASNRVKRVGVAEMLPQVIDWMRGGLVPLSTALNADTRFDPLVCDVYALLSEPPQRQFDLILIDVDHSPAETLTGRNAGFYTEAGLERAREHLAPGGVLGVWSCAENSAFAGALRRTFAEVRATPVTFRNRHAGEEQTDWLYFGRMPATGKDRPETRGGASGVPRLSP